MEQRATPLARGADGLGKKDVTWDRDKERGG